MRFVGLAYLVGVVGDGALSMLSMAVPALEGASDAFSTLMFVFRAIVLVLALIGRLKPRVVFLVPVVLYAAFTAMGVALAVAVTVKTGGKRLSEDFGLQDIVAVFPWFGPVNWVLLTLTMAIGTACLYRFVSTLTQEGAVVEPAGGPSHQFWICPQCRRHVPARLSACRCGFSLQGASEVQFTSPTTGVPASAPSAITTGGGAFPSAARPRPIWNPNAACNWSLLFSPAFGAYIHAQNWMTLNEPQRARSAKAWFYGSLGILGMSLPLHLVGVAEQAGRGLGILYLLIWYFAAGRPQARYVKGKYGKDYPRRAWGKPLLIAMASVVAYFALAIVLVVLAGLLRRS
jgi:hypothetical protein